MLGIAVAQVAPALALPFGVLARRCSGYLEWVAEAPPARRWPRVPVRLRAPRALGGYVALARGGLGRR